jgi:hypothetical protein
VCPERLLAIQKRLEHGALGSRGHQHVEQDLAHQFT